MELTGAADALKVIQSGADHQVRIHGLDQETLVLETLGEWLGMELPLAAEALTTLQIPPEAAFFGTPYAITLDPGGVSR